MKKQTFKHLVRICNTDLEGEKQTNYALTKIKGISFNFANAICTSLNIKKTKKAKELTEQEIKKIEQQIQTPNLPTWLLNRRKDFATGKNKHLITSKLELQKELDIKRLQSIKSYRGLRHAWGLPLRGQRTRSNFRKGSALGVKKKTVKKSGK